MLTRIDMLATAINDRDRKIDLHFSEIDGLKHANALDREELAALNAAIGSTPAPTPAPAPAPAPEPKQLGSVEAVQKALEGMTDERPTGAARWGDGTEAKDKHGNPVGTKYKPDGFA
jgi:hypothetical protein